MLSGHRCELLGLPQCEGGTDDRQAGPVSQTDVPGHGGHTWQQGQGGPGTSMSVFILW